MISKKHLIRRYLLATVVGIVVGLIGLLAGYQHNLESARTRMFELNDSPALLGDDDPRFQFAQEYLFWCFLLSDNSAVNILFGSTLLVPFAVYTFDVVAAARRKRERGAA